MVKTKKKEEISIPLDSFIHISKNKDSCHAIGITSDGDAYSWPLYEKKSTINEFGQLGQGTKKTFGIIPINVKVCKAYTGGTDESGHSALLDETRQKLYLCGCDRWQQLGLGSHHGGSLGYTWKGGNLWQTTFKLNEFLNEWIKEDTIRDVALGGDHTIVLTENSRDVIAFGRGSEGQLGGYGKPFVSAPIRSKLLSGKQVSAVCAVQNCTVALKENGTILKMVGKCNGKEIQSSLKRCIQQSKLDGLLL